MFEVIVEAEKGFFNVSLLYRGHFAVTGIGVMFPAYPIGGASTYFSLEVCPAVPTLDCKGEIVFCLWGVGRLITSRTKEGLSGVKYLLRYDGWMAVGYVVFISLAMVSFLLKGQSVCGIEFLEQSMASIPFILQYVVHSGILPVRHSSSGRKAELRNFICNVCHADAREISVEDETDDCCFSFVNFKHSITQVISEGGTACDELTTLHSFLITPPHIAGD